MTATSAPTKSSKPTRRPTTLALPQLTSVFDASLPSTKATTETAIIARRLLKDALTDVSRALAGKSTLPVLAHVLLQAEAGSLTLTATDLDLALTRVIEAEVSGVWALTVPGKLLSDVVGALPEGPIHIVHLAEQHAIRLAAGSFETTIKGLDAEEFPILPQVTGPTLQLAGDVLASAVADVGFAAATDSTRPVLQGVLLAITGEQATLTATDGLRLGRRQLTIPDASRELSAIIPAAQLSMLAPIFAGSDMVTLTIGENQIAFHTSGRRAICRVMEGKYPDVARVIPTSHTTRIIVERTALVRAAKLARLLATSQIVRLDPSTVGMLTLSANAAEVGDQRSEVDATITGTPIVVALNVTLLLAALDPIATEQVAIELTTPQRPIILTPVGDDTLLQLIMPMTIR